MTTTPRNRRGGRTVRGCLVALTLVLVAIGCGEALPDRPAAARAPLTTAADHRAIEQAGRLLVSRCLARTSLDRPVTRQEGRIYFGLRRSCAARALERIYGDPLEHREIIQARNAGVGLAAYAEHIRRAAARARRLT